MVSVCLATYNGSRFLREQLDSVLCQLSPIDELVVSDDGSTDETLDILAEYVALDSRLKIVKNTGRQGLVGNFESALKKAKGDCIFLCDQDDVWHPHKLELMLDYLQQYKFVVHDAAVVDPHLSVIHPSYFSLRPVKAGFWNNLYRSSLLGCCMGFSSEAMNLILPFPKRILWHDMWIGLMLQVFYKPRLVSTPLLYYRRHGANLSTASDKSMFSVQFKVYYRCVMLIEVMKRMVRFSVNRVIFRHFF